MDYFFHLMGWIPMNGDIFIHHVLGLFWYNHFRMTRDMPQSSHQKWCNSILSSECSSIFLSVMNFDQEVHILPRPVKTLNQLVFVGTFLYYRLVWYYREMLLPLGSSSLDEYAEILTLHGYSPVYVKIIKWSMYAFFVLNLYWGWKIIQMMMRVFRAKY